MIQPGSWIHVSRSWTRIFCSFRFMKKWCVHFSIGGALYMKNVSKRQCKKNNVACLERLRISCCFGRRLPWTSLLFQDLFSFFYLYIKFRSVIIDGRGKHVISKRVWVYIISFIEGQLRATFRKHLPERLPDALAEVRMDVNSRPELFASMISNQRINGM